MLLVGNKERVKLSAGKNSTITEVRRLLGKPGGCATPVTRVYKSPSTLHLVIAVGFQVSRVWDRVKAL